ncbi:MAG: hypothetical protein ACQSGP_17445 [Frankia sp.]
MCDPRRDDRGLVTHEIAAFITERALVTVHPTHGFTIDTLTARWDATPDRRRSSPGQRRELG